MNRHSSSIKLLLSLSAAYLQADVLTLNPSNQEIVLSSNGPDASGVGNFRVTLGVCSLQVTNTVCTISGRYSGLGGGIYTLTLTYAGNGPSPLSATSAPGTDVFTVSRSNGTLALTVKPDGGSPANFYDTNATFSLTPVTSRCFGITVCSVGTAGRTAGATLIGPVSAQFDVTPMIRPAGGVITASAYGALSTISPGTWVEIYGTNLATTLGQSWRAADFVASRAPTALAGTSVSIGGLAAFVQYVSDSQVNVLTPMALNPGRADVIVTTPGGQSLPFQLVVSALQPLFLAPAALQVAGLQYVFAEFPDNSTFVLPQAPSPASPAAARWRATSSLFTESASDPLFLRLTPAKSRNRQTPFLRSPPSLRDNKPPYSTPAWCKALSVFINSTS